jgi:thymidine kinase
MDPKTNPFEMSAGNLPALLAGRETEQESIDILLDRLSNGLHDRSIIFYGLRGVGKTVLLLKAEEIAEQKRWIVADPIEARPSLNFREEFSRTAIQAHRILSIKKSFSDAGKSLTESIKQLKVSFSINADGISASMEAANLDPKETLEMDFKKLIKELGLAAKERDTGIIFCIDELQFLEKHEMEAIAAAIHEASKRNLPIVIIAAGLPQTPKLLTIAKSYAERLFAFKELGKLKEEDTYLALSSPAEERGVAFLPDALNKIYELSQGYPAFIQAYGKYAWNEGQDNVITLKDILNAEGKAWQELVREFFLVRFERATVTERIFMSAMASLGEGPYYIKEVNNALGKRSTQSSKARDGLINKGLIYSPEYGQLDFTAPQFAKFMRKHQPF